MGYFSLNNNKWFEKNDLDLTVMTTLTDWYDLLTFENGSFGIKKIYYRSQDNLASAGACKVELRLVDKNGEDIVTFASNSSSPSTALVPGANNIVEFDTSRYLEPGSRLQARTLTALLTAGTLNIVFLTQSKDIAPEVRTVGY